MRALETSNDWDMIALQARCGGQTVDRRRRAKIKNLARPHVYIDMAAPGHACNLVLLLLTPGVQWLLNLGEVAEGVLEVPGRGHVRRDLDGARGVVPELIRVCEVEVALED